MVAFFNYTWFLWWLLTVVAILRCFRAASCHDEEMALSDEENGSAQWDRHDASRKRPHDVVSGGHAA